MQLVPMPNAAPIAVTRGDKRELKPGGRSKKSHPKRGERRESFSESIFVAADGIPTRSDRQRSADKHRRPLRQLTRSIVRYRTDKTWKAVLIFRPDLRYCAIRDGPNRPILSPVSYLGRRPVGRLCLSVRVSKLIFEQARTDYDEASRRHQT